MHKFISFTARLTLIVGAIAVSASARAQTPPAAPPATATPPQPPWVVACEADAKKLCDAELKAKTDERPCLLKNEAKLSEKCKDVFLYRYKAIEICKEDIQKVCGGASEGKTLGACFNEKYDQLSKPCQTALSKIKKGAKITTPVKPKGEAKAEKAESGEKKAEK